VCVTCPILRERSDAWPQRRSSRNPDARLRCAWDVFQQDSAARLTTRTPGVARFCQAWSWPASSAEHAGHLPISLHTPFVCCADTRDPRASWTLFCHTQGHLGLPRSVSLREKLDLRSPLCRPSGPCKISRAHLRSLSGESRPIESGLITLDLARFPNRQREVRGQSDPFQMMFLVGGMVEKKALII